VREISITPINREDKKNDADALGKSLIEAVRQIKPPVVNVSPAAVNIERGAQDKGSYLITVNRDNHGRVQSMVVKPYEPS
jgi:hypothetical protein